MEFDGTFTIADVTSEEVWLALSDPVMIQEALPGCQFFVEIEDPDDVEFDELEAAADDEAPPVLPEADPETVAERALEEGQSYAALMQISAGGVNPRFETIATIDRREFPEMTASGEGRASNSSFEMSSGMTIRETDDGVDVDWEAEADVFGRIAQMGGRVIDPVANRVVNRFFDRIASQLRDVGDESNGLRDRIRNVI